MQVEGNKMKITHKNSPFQISDIQHFQIAFKPFVRIESKLMCNYIKLLSVKGLYMHIEKKNAYFNTIDKELTFLNELMIKIFESGHPVSFTCHIDFDTIYLFHILYLLLMSH